MNQERISHLRYVSRKLFRELGMLQLSHEKKTPSHWHALIEISKTPDITISQVGNLLLLSPSATSRIVSSLIQEGLIDYKDGADRREKRLQITKKGLIELETIDQFSNTKILGAFAHLSEEEQNHIVQAIEKYANALEKSRLSQAGPKVNIHTLPTSRTLRKQIITMIETIQKDEFSVPITPETNSGIMKAEEEYCYNHSCNFWYAVNEKGKIIGSIGLKRIDDKCGELKKFFIQKEYRGKGVAQKLLKTLIDTASKHRFSWIYLGTLERLEAAQQFYKKHGFTRIPQSQLPSRFVKFHLDTLFFRASVEELHRRTSN